MLSVLFILLLLLCVERKEKYKGKLYASLSEMDPGKFTIFFDFQGKKSNSNELSVLKILMRIYAHQENALENLETMCRINPDFTSPFRNDLEFCIP